ncbi:MULTISPECIES: SSI family serine proteinase inhibitor [unclassified Streptomyces]|uniref:SSI family serine proteinase inhibitor n=1 Tax=unclassified Streptomyces TaxID=2593676 RepID=UPI002DDB27CE|nr:SSI family serine proteinase inhibitor [Streptomyces sp. NBC_01795]WSA93747.1 subtilase-type protease inhibitor [Streptomyces sp. NBC_01795]WSS42426.1 subtilase-type protease inhibitor [Streptomyces sp. NBC_01187]
MPRRTVTVLAVTAVALLGLAGPASAISPSVTPASASAASESDTTASATSPGAVRSKDHLTFTVADSGNAALDGSYTVRCRPAGGDHPAPGRACAALEHATSGGKNPFEPVSSDAICTMVYGGPATARVTGTWHGRKVDARFKRSNGCEIERWNSLVPALPKTS